MPRQPTRCGSLLEKHGNRSKGRLPLYFFTERDRGGTYLSTKYKNKAAVDRCLVVI